MRVLLRIRAPEVPPREEAREVGDRLLIGRSPACDLVLEDRRVSNRHLMLETAGGVLFAVDQESANGSRVIRGQSELPAPPGARVALRDGDELRIGRVRIRLSVPEMPASYEHEEPPPTAELMLTPLGPVNVRPDEGHPEELHPDDIIEEIDDDDLDEDAPDDPREVLRVRRAALKARLAAQEAVERTATDPALLALQAEATELQARRRAAEEATAEATRQTQALVGEVVGRTRDVERLQAELSALEAAVEAAVERGLRLEGRLAQVQAEQGEAEARRAELTRLLPPRQARHDALAMRQREEAARLAARRRGGP